MHWFKVCNAVSFSTFTGQLDSQHTSRWNPIFSNRSLFPPPTQPPATTKVLSVPLDLLLLNTSHQRSHTKPVLLYLVSQGQPGRGVSAFHSFFRRNGSPLYAQNTSCSFIHQLIEIWVVFPL